MYKLKLQQTTHTKTQESNCVTHNKNISQSGESNMINKSIKKKAVNQTVQFSYETVLIEKFEILTDEQCQAISEGMTYYPEYNCYELESFESPAFIGNVYPWSYSS
jgi:hypothetical protein